MQKYFKGGHREHGRQAPGHLIFMRRSRGGQTDVLSRRCYRGRQCTRRNIHHHNSPATFFPRQQSDPILLFTGRAPKSYLRRAIKSLSCSLVLITLLDKIARVSETRSQCSGVLILRGPALLTVELTLLPNTFSSVCLFYLNDVAT